MERKRVKNDNQNFQNENQNCQLFFSVYSQIHHISIYLISIIFYLHQLLDALTQKHFELLESAKLLNGNIGYVLWNDI